jgi:L-ascorbate metabolism protein UlaG (beta-lactamase superfamily)
MKLTYFGHACFEIEIEGIKLLFDPFISPNELAKEINIASINPDYILISHGHEDHIADAEKIAVQSGATIVSNFEITSWFNKKGLEKTHPMNHGGSWNFPFGKVKYVNAIHSSTLPDGSNGGNPGGFVIESAKGNFYFAGDTALTMDMKLIPMFTQLDFAILPIGDNFTMGIEEAVIASNFIDCEKIVGMHYDTFGYIEIDHQKAKEQFSHNDGELILLKIGETKDI